MSLGELPGLLAEIAQVRFDLERGPGPLVPPLRREGAGTSAHFIFATEDGTIAGWNSGTTAVLKVDNADFVNGPVYKGLAIGTTGTGNFIYATNFRAGTIDVYNTNFAKVTLGTGGFGTFTDPTIPLGFAPFGFSVVNEMPKETPGIAVPSSLRRIGSV